MYLILAIDEDVHADAVLYYLEKYGKKVKRFDPAFLFDEYGSIETEARREKIIIDISCTSGKLIFTNGDIVSSDDIEGVYCRSFYIPKAKDSSSTADQLATAEIRSTVQGFFSLIPQSCRWINNPYTEDKVDNKIYQHQCAVAHGLDIPDTIVTNCSDNVKAFVFGRMQDINNSAKYLKYSYLQAIKDALGDLRKPILLDVDLGHVPPSLPFINNSLARIEYKNNNIYITYLD